VPVFKRRSGCWLRSSLKRAKSLDTKPPEVRRAIKPTPVQLLVLLRTRSAAALMSDLVRAR